MRSKIENNIEEAAAHFKRGDIVIFPTDTIYGIGCIVSNEDSIKRLYKIRKTKLSKPTLILVNEMRMAKEYGYISKKAESVLQRFWPGPLTVIVKARKKETKIIQGDTDKIAIRIPHFSLISGIINKVLEPIIAPSANFPEKIPPASFKEIDKRIMSLVNYSIDLGKLPGKEKMVGIESTIIDLSEKPYRLVRKGAVSKESLEGNFLNIFSEGGRD